MREITTTIKAYTFAELSDAAKEKVISKEQESAGENFNADYLIDDIKETASLFGLEIDQFYYSGFWSQGDGASFEGNYQYKKGALQLLVTDRPNDAELHGIVKDLQEIQRKYFYKLSCSIVQRGHYYHENTIYIDNLYFDGNLSYADNGDIEEELLSCFRRFAVWAYDYIRSSYEHDTSREAVLEYLENSENEYTENGKAI